MCLIQLQTTRYIDKGHLAFYNASTMGKKRKNLSVESEEIQVTLKPIFGIKPGLYLAGLYSLIILLILFFLLLFPGVTNRGREIRFFSNVPNAAVYINEKHAGTTPFSTFVPAGEYTVEYRKKFFSSNEIPISVKGPIFASLFFPGKDSIMGFLLLEDGRGLIDDAVKRYSSWSLVDGFYESYQPPPIAEDMVLSLRTPYSELKSKTSEREAFFDRKDMTEKALFSMLLSTSHNRQVKDLVSAFFLFNSQGPIMNSSNLLDSLNTILRLSSRYPGFFLWALQFSSSEIANDVAAIPEFSNAISGLVEAVNEKADDSGKPATSNQDQRLIVKNREFVPVRRGTFIMGPISEEYKELKRESLSFENFPHKVNVDRFYIQRTEVSIGEYRDFLEAHPEWRKENSKGLLAKNLVSKDYLSTFPEMDVSSSAADTLPITHVSWYAAKAYCDWLTGSLPPYLSNYEVRLPQEEEWEYVSRFEISGDGDQLFKSGINGPISVGENPGSEGEVLHLLGNVWEWSENCYYNEDYFFFSEDGKKKLRSEVMDILSAEKIVRGGSWANMPYSIQYTTRGSQPPSWCTPFLGFRPVIAEREE